MIDNLLKGASGQGSSEYEPDVWAGRKSGIKSKINRILGKKNVLLIVKLTSKIVSNYKCML